MRFLINPKNRGSTMARRLPPRNAKGRFVKRARARSNPKRKRRSRRALPPRRADGRFKKRGGGSTRRRRTTRSRARRNPVRRYARRNPSMKRTVDMLVDGSLTAVQLTVGKAASRSVPDLLKLQQSGNVGLAIRVASAIAIGWVADEFMGGDLGSNLLVGGLQGAVEDLAVEFNVPWLANSLRRTPGVGMGRYASARRPPPPAANAGMGTHHDRMSRYAYAGGY